MALSSLTRNQLIELAYRKVRVLEPGQTMSAEQLSEGILALNLIIRELDEAGNKIWAEGTAPTSLVLQEQVGIYASAQSLPTNIMELTQVSFRSANGTDTPLTILSHTSYEDIPNKLTAGVPEVVFLARQKQPADNVLYVWPLPTDIDSQSEVIGSDALNYACIRSHTSATTNKPITGANWRLYWEQTGSSGSAWAADTAYTAPQLLRLWYKQPLADFTTASQNPDIPPSMQRQLLYELAADLSVDTGKDAEFERRLRANASSAEARTFARANKRRSTNLHNKATYY